SDTVVLRGLTLNGLTSANDGVLFNTGRVLYVENCDISAFSNLGIELAGPGIFSLRNLNVRDCLAGVQISHSSGTTTASIVGCHLDGNLFAGFRALTTGSAGSMTTASHSTANNNHQFGWVCGLASSGTDLLNLEFCEGSGNALGDGLFNNSVNAS